MRICNPHVLAAVAVLASVACPAFADDTRPYRGGYQYRDGGVKPPSDDSLYRDLGGKERIAVFVADFVDLVTTDDRIKQFYDNTNLERLKQKVTEEFIDLSGGPGKYTGQRMDKVHTGLGIRNGDFNALVEDLQTAMDHAKVPFPTQNRLLALLAPMQHDIVKN